jgi:hypothetical protein
MEHIANIINGQQGNLFLIVILVIVLIIFGVIVFLIIRVKNFHFKTKNGQEIGLNSDFPNSFASPEKINDIKAISDGKYVKIDKKTYQSLIEYCNITSQEFNSKTDLIKEQLDLKIKLAQKQCIDRAIDTLNLDYAVKQQEDSERIDNSLTVLELYLKVDMNEILKHELLMIEQDEKLSELTDDDIQKKLKSATDNCIRKLKIKANKYIIVNKDIFIPLLESETNALKDNVYETIKTYQKASKEEKQAIDNAIEEKHKILENRIKNLFDVIDTVTPSVSL